MDNRELAFESVWGASRLLSSKRLSPVELTHVCLERIERLNPRLNAFITVAAESALNDARAAESEIQRGQYRGPLHGIPVALKDMIDTAGLRTTAASARYANRVPQVDAEVVSRLRRAGAIVLGKLNMQEFAYGGTSVPSYFGPTRNPWNIECIAGGSSGGSAAAVAAGLCFAALGTDTGGSIRQPAAFCGIVGMKPSYGLVSNRGVIPLAASLDHVGPLTRTAEDCQLLLDAIAGYDAQEPSSEWHAPAVEPARSGLAGVRIGVARAFFFDGLHAEVASALERALAALQSLGARVHDLELEVSQDRTVFRAEAFAAHADALTHSSHLYQPETLAKLRLGASLDLPTYLAARRELKMQRRRIGEVFRSVDVLVSPTVPVPAPRLADYPSDFEGVLVLEASSILRNTRPFNIFGIPACAGLPSHAQLHSALWAARAQQNGGFNLDMWGTVVNRDGIVCAVAFTGADRGSQWPGSRVISAQKANTANAFSLPQLALSTANLFSAVQPGGSLFGLQASNPVNTRVAYRGESSNYGTADDPMVGGKIGGVNVFGGGLALYNSKGELIGAIGVSGDSSCADHNISWRTRHNLSLDYVPAGVSGDSSRPDNIVYDITPAAGLELGVSASGWGHAFCSAASKQIASKLPVIH